MNNKGVLLGPELCRAVSSHLNGMAERFLNKETFPYAGKYGYL
jgi:hypothetical protein